MAKVTCGECNTTFDVELNDYETETESSEGSMGPKIQYWTVVDDSCPKGHSYSFTVNEEEYPENNFSTPEVNSTENCSVSL